VSATFTATSQTGAPFGIAFLTQPAKAVAGANFSVTIAVVDANGNTTPTSTPIDVAISFAVNPDTALFTTASILSGTTINGIVELSVGIDRVGSGFQLVASSAALTRQHPNSPATAVSAPFDVTLVVTGANAKPSAPASLPKPPVRKPPTP
jgi:hypothetical protein